MSDRSKKPFKKTTIKKKPLSGRKKETKKDTPRKRGVKRDKPEAEETQKEPSVKKKSKVEWKLVWHRQPFYLGERVW